MTWWTGSCICSVVWSGCISVNKVATEWKVLFFGLEYPMRIDSMLLWQHTRMESMCREFVIRVGMMLLEIRKDFSRIFYNLPRALVNISAAKLLSGKNPSLCKSPKYISDVIWQLHEERLFSIICRGIHNCTADELSTLPSTKSAAFNALKQYLRSLPTSEVYKRNALQIISTRFSRRADVYSSVFNISTRTAYKICLFKRCDLQYILNLHYYYTPLHYVSYKKIETVRTLKDKDSYN